MIFSPALNFKNDKQRSYKILTRLNTAKIKHQSYKVKPRKLTS
jgi:hypothetical protein